MIEKIVTLCFVINGNKVLLGMKKRGFGKGKWNGFGGKVTEGENYEDAAKRELEEESGITALKLDYSADVFFNYAHTDIRHSTRVFIVRQYSGEPVETEEMSPRWFEISNLPYSEMWIDDKYWVGNLLEGLPKGKKLVAEFDFDTDEKISNHVVKFLPF